MYIKNILDNFKKYSFLLNQLVGRDFKVKYKRSVLGVVWSLLYPVLMMAVMAAVFSNVFKFSVPGVNYLVYLMTGLTFFNYYSEASNLAMSSVVGNFSLLNKIYIPKYIFPLSKCLFVGINFLLTLIPLYGVILMMAVMAAVFSNVFKFSVPGVNYLVYLMTGLTFFNYYSEASNLAMSSVVGNFSLLNKIYIPKYIFPLSKCLFVGINFLLTLIPLYGVILLSGSGETKCHITVLHLLLPFSYLCLLLFTIGAGLVLSTVSVFLRDMFYIYGIVLTILTYFTPIMYDINMLDPWIQRVLKLNPLYHYITFARTIILYDQIPSVRSFVICGVSAVVVLIIGVVVFKKNQDKFIYYM